MFASHLCMSPRKHSWRDRVSRLQSVTKNVSCAPLGIFFQFANNSSYDTLDFDTEIKFNILPSMALQIRVTRRCLRNLMTNSIDRRRISSFSYSVVTLKILAAGWSIVSVELELWREFVNETTQTFGAVTFFIRSRQWMFYDFFHFPAKLKTIWKFI